MPIFIPPNQFPGDIPSTEVATWFGVSPSLLAKGQLFIEPRRVFQTSRDDHIHLLTGKLAYIAGLSDDCTYGDANVHFVGGYLTEKRDTFDARAALINEANRLGHS